jgi:hypothetical protein
VFFIVWHLLNDEQSHVFAPRDKNVKPDNVPTVSQLARRTLEDYRDEKKQNSCKGGIPA